VAEKLITKAKRGDLHSRRMVMRDITDPTVVHVLFTEIAPAVEKREGGYTRITKVGPRKGDNAPMAIIEIVTEPVVKKTRAKKTEDIKPAKKAAVTTTVEDVVEEVVDEVEAEEVEAEEVEAEEAVEDVADEADAEEAAEETAEEA